VLLFLTGLLALLPNAALGGIVANAVLSLIETKEMRRLFQVRRSEFVIAAVCLMSVLVLGSLLAVIIAFLLSTIDMVRRAASPSIGALRELPGRRGFYVTSGDGPGTAIPGLVVLRFGAQLFFANAQAFKERVEREIEGADPPVRWFVLDMEAVNDIDSTGAEALRGVINDLKSRGITFAIARAEPPAPDQLRAYGLLDEIGEEHVFLTNRSAAEAFFRATDQAAPQDAQVIG
jgi:MFS superfamily sulfate permease-like transporter